MESILFVCLGNICRSPTAKAVFDWKLRRAELAVETDSAGTTAYHVGSPPDPRAQRIARQWGLDISTERARVVIPEDFSRFDAIFVMDRSNLEDLRARRPADSSTRLDLVMSLAPDYGIEEVPDPYYGGVDGFQRVIDMLEVAADRLVEELRTARQ
ncbi:MULTISPECIES: low molecular weight protein-tyrosine-phosphatase [unclassified Wenzhouxiangella]|uniref:low molecular weight protein-tyrosine-phosphatase n=1 Tax=unclassified Wenzhouxiangella TaxID=2613841 RepID=UPI000E32B673|nr:MULTISPECIES: low molecular weight protein-tyrosine-phosphatase [unclassified Wenzhouxiangella]RFF28232.1 low molecular weight phosphotyrosine protein phosphatase [Wenzhouxiangella sp. 15181]RFP67907.1 low molecular weight phosphotyrosine protein phosphatase [Wenzhouxiangella sp. 15190]